jgi:hypothetical protein
MSRSLNGHIDIGVDDRTVRAKPQKRRVMQNEWIRKRVN